MTERNKYKIAMYKNGEFIKYGYPCRYLDDKVKDLAKGIKFYKVEIVEPESYNYDQFNKTPLPLELTTNKSEFKHILIAYQKFELVEYSETVITNKIDVSCESYIEDNLPLTYQTANITRFMYLDILKMNGTITDLQIKEMAHLNDLDNWAISCRDLKNTRIEDYKTNGNFPDLQTWPEMPIKNY